MTLPLRSKRRREPDVRNSTARTRDLGTRLPVEQRGTTAGLTCSLRPVSHSSLQKGQRQLFVKWLVLPAGNAKIIAYLVGT